MCPVGHTHTNPSAGLRTLAINSHSLSPTNEVRLKPRKNDARNATEELKPAEENMEVDSMKSKVTDREGLTQTQSPSSRAGRMLRRKGKEKPTTRLWLFVPERSRPLTIFVLCSSSFFSSFFSSFLFGPPLLFCFCFLFLFCFGKTLPFHIFR